MKHTLARLASGAGLVALTGVALLPVVLTVRQSVTPRRLVGQFPVPLWPEGSSLEAIHELLAAQSLIEPLLRSVAVALLATSVSVVLALPAGWALARSRWFGLVGVQTALIARVIPPIVIALPLAAWLVRLGLRDRPTGIGLALAHLSVTLPLAVLVCVAACRDVPVHLEEAAEIDGAGRLATLRHVVLPLTRGAVGAAALFGFLFSWDDFTHAVVIQVLHPTLPPLIGYLAQHGELGQASALALLMLVPAAAFMALVSRLIVRSGGLNLGDR